MQLKPLIALGALCFSLAAPAYAQVNGNTFQEVPREHWSYAVLDEAEKAGIATGFPGGVFRGQRLLTRYEMAVSVQRVVGAFSRPAATVDSALREAVLQKLNLSPAFKLPELTRLVGEFTPELRLLGADPEILRREVKQRLSLAQVTPPSSPSPKYEEGAKLARQEWEQGKTVLYVGGLPQALQIDGQLGIPLYNAFGCIVTPAILDQTRGHNEEVYRLILARGLPANTRLHWLAEIKEPRKFWDAPTARPAKVQYGGPPLTLPQTQVTLRLTPARVEEPARLEITEKGGKTLQWDLYRLDRRAPTVTARDGAEGSHLLFLRWHTSEGGSSGETYQVIDTALGRQLNRAYDPAPAPPLAGAQRK